MSDFQRRVKVQIIEERKGAACAVPDKKPGFVRYLPAASGQENLMFHGKGVKDRRVQKTQALLHEALGSLIREKPYDEIVVKEILDRANVGRSTFYMHFRDKDELLASGIYEMLRGLRPAEVPMLGKKPERVIRFSLPVFEHIHRHRQAGAPGMGARGRAILHERLQQVLAELIADDVEKVRQGRRKSAGQLPSELIVHYIASTFVLVLNWWVESDSPLSAMEVNSLFRALTIPTLSACLD
jgi:AcrR family transcriptional regulator